ncbi:hypothetical protein N7449_002240 [Penicillium cf. viridicatum]|uniref:Uncharacterized protein n=1 Tax=Penicillium cf. viridicatum TaxID=2972119 RepID=A0A9W9T3E0_9EURO|nr:hypothetical protein N7449_002240 [Penicillium cf. viridicatum]
MAHVYTIFVPSITFSLTAQQVITELLPAYGASGLDELQRLWETKDRTVFATVDVIFNSQYLLLHPLQLDLFTRSAICVPSTSSNTPAVASTKKRVLSPVLIKTLLPARALKSNLVNELASGALVTVAKVASDVSYIFSYFEADGAAQGLANKILQALNDSGLEAVHRYALCCRRVVGFPALSVSASR